MFERPVIIIGGGVWGSLLAVRLRQCLPEVSFRLYEDSSTLGEDLSLSFHQTDLSEKAFNWMKPFITHQWSKFQVEFPRFQKIVDDLYCTINSEDFDRKLKQIIPAQNLCLNQDITVEEALQIGSFVIDTRNNGYFKARGYQKTMSLMMKIHGHGISTPITVDAKVDQKGGFRYLQYLPLDESTLMVKDIRYSTNPKIYDENFEEDLLTELKIKGHEVSEIQRREVDFRKVPLEKFMPETSGRVIRLEGYMHDTTGDILPDAVRLIDRIVETSFRFGEIKEVLKNYQLERESKKRFQRLLNRFVFQSPTPCHNRYQFFQFFYQLPKSLRQKFYAGDMEFFDLIKSMLRQPSIYLPKSTRITMPQALGNIVSKT